MTPERKGTPTPLRALLTANPAVAAAVRLAEERAAQPTSTAETGGDGSRTAACACAEAGHSPSVPVRWTAVGYTFCACTGGLAARARFEASLALQSPASGVPPRLALCSMESARHLLADGPEASDARAEAFAAAEAFVGAVAAGAHPGRGLVLTGPVGVGKSGLLAAVTHALQGLGLPVLWFDYPGLVTAVQAAYGTDRDGALLLNAQRCPLLVLDELGDPYRARGDYQETEDRRRIVYQVLAHRAAHLRPTLVSANYGSLDEMADQFDPRIADRLREACELLPVDGRSLRGAGPSSAPRP